LDANPTQVEGVLPRDADILEQLGAIGAPHAVAKTGRDSRYDTFSSVRRFCGTPSSIFPENCV
jgi:uncharacterized protein